LAFGVGAAAGVAEEKPNADVGAAAGVGVAGVENKLVEGELMGLGWDEKEKAGVAGDAAGVAAAGLPKSDVEGVAGVQNAAPVLPLLKVLTVLGPHVTIFKWMRLDGICYYLWMCVIEGWFLLVVVFCCFVMDDRLSVRPVVVCLPVCVSVCFCLFVEVSSVVTKRKWELLTVLSPIT